MHVENISQVTEATGGGIVEIRGTCLWIWRYDLLRRW